MKKIKSIIVLVMVVCILSGSGLHQMVEAAPLNKLQALSTGLSTKKDITIKEDKKINSIFVDWLAGDINVLKSKSNDIRLIQKTDHNFNQKKLLTYAIKNGKLTVTDARIKGSNNLKPKEKEAKTSLDIYLPSKMYNQLKIESINSQVTANNLNVKDLDIDIISGMVNFSGKFSTVSIETVSAKIKGSINKAEKVNLETTSGAIAIKGYMKNASIDTTSGSITGTDVSCDNLEIESTSGDIKISSSVMIQSFNSSTTSGDLTISIPENTGFTCEFDKVSGTFKSDFKMTKSGNKYKYKNGKTYFKFESTSGNMTINKN